MPVTKELSIDAAADGEASCARTIRPPSTVLEARSDAVDATRPVERAR